MRIPKEKGSERAKGFAYVEFNSTISHRVSENTVKPGPEVTKLFSCSTQLRMKFILLINV